MLGRASVLSPPTQVGGDFLENTCFKAYAYYINKVIMVAKPQAQKDTSPATQPEVVEKKSGAGKKVLIVFAVILLATLPALGVYYWQSTQAKQQEQNLQKQIEELQKQKQDLQKELKKAASEQASVCPANLTPQQVSNVQASIESMNTAALEQLLADTVEVTFAASEKGGNVTKTQAIADLDYLQSATMPWNWSINQATLNAYKNGDYKVYLADDDIFGVAANKYFVSFRVDCGKIDQIFVAASTDLL